MEKTQSRMGGIHSCLSPALPREQEPGSSLFRPSARSLSLSLLKAPF